ncbi:MAG: DNA polymerase III subunit gamma/tau [Peptococcaceae bacterium]|nr:DNA polymerase III subunit gamma/tau [Peptococcaceae bacterium]
MAWQALYRVWRPRTFRELVGQDHVARTLKNAVMHDRIAHAYLFCGPRGTGKTTSARLLAKAVNCREPDAGEPCNQCHNCLAVNDGSSVDVFEIDAASNRGIEEIKSLRERVKFSPSHSRYRVYIIDEVHMLSHDAFNAFLKTLEEPPVHVVFILATTEAHKVPLTILSRCQRFDFRRIGEGEIGGRLAEIAAGAGLEVEREAVDVIARVAEGGLRDAISILDQAAATGEIKVTARHIHDLLGTVTAETVTAVADHLAEGRTARVLELVAEVEKWGKDPKLFLRDLAGHLRRRLLAGLEGGRDASRLWYVLHILTQAEQSLKWAGHPELVLELALVRAGHPEWGFLPEEMHQRLEQVEQRLAAGDAVRNIAVKREEKPEKAAGPPAPPASDSKPEPVANPKPAAPRVKEKQAAPGSESAQRVASNPGDRGETDRSPLPSAPAEGGLARVRQAWPAVLEKVKGENQFLFHSVSKATLVQVEGDRLILGFARGEEFYRDYLERDGGAGLAGALDGICPGPWRIASVLSGETGPAPARKKVQETRDDTAYYLEKLFDAQHVGQGREPRRTGGGKEGEKL